MLRTDRFKYILETGADLLYDLDDDPSEGSGTEVTIRAWPMSAPN